MYTPSEPYAEPDPDAEVPECTSAAASSTADTNGDGPTALKPDADLVVPKARWQSWSPERRKPGSVTNNRSDRKQIHVRDLDKWFFPSQCKVGQQGGTQKRSLPPRRHGHGHDQALMGHQGHHMTWAYGALTRALRAPTQGPIVGRAVN